jgi:phenylacetate-CoA ligase
MIYDYRAETMGREDLEQLQAERLKAVLFRARQYVAFYRKALDEAGVRVEKIGGPADLPAIPFTRKADLLANYPYDMFAVPLRDVVRLHSTSGTKGKPIVVGHTRNDLRNWTQLMARVLSAAGVEERDLVQVSFHYNQSSAALGFHYGAERLGASVIPSSSESAARQLMVMRDYRTSALVSTPGFALHLATAMEAEGLSKNELALRTGVFGAEPWTEKLREEIEERLGLRAYDNYGLTELCGPGVAYECEERDGLHVNEDHFLVEVVDPATGRSLPAGERGELVFTTLTREAFPLLRYRTGDLASIDDRPCPCGRTHVRISRVFDRLDDMLIIEGVNVFPSQIEDAILKVPGLGPHYLVVVERSGGIDSLEVQVEASSDFPFMDELSKMEELRSRLERRLEEALDLRLRVVLKEPNSLPRSNGAKIRRVTEA